jgi:dTDP-4-dehydrorhamnose reductase
MSKSLVILGTSGMIGSAIARYFENNHIKVIEVNRKYSSKILEGAAFQFDAKVEDLASLDKFVPGNSLILNCYGLIRHKIDINSAQSIEDAQVINTRFPIRLTKYAEERNHRIIQIGTDCVFSGKTGSYSEGATKDPIDVYGETKARGEEFSKSLMTLRVSVIGEEVKSHLEIMDWVLNSEKNAILQGFKNHFWNGVTSLHLAKILYVIVKEDLFSAGYHHLVPADRISKFDLLELIAKFGGRDDLTVNPYEAQTAIDRTLTTIYPEFNSMLWQLAGYASPATIAVMINEYFSRKMHN